VERAAVNEPSGPAKGDRPDQVDAEVSKCRHEIRNRASVAAGLSALVVQELDQPSSDIKEHVRRLSHNASRLGELIEQMEDLTTLEDIDIPRHIDHAQTDTSSKSETMLRLLVVEDDDDHFELLSSLLTRGAQGSRWEIHRAITLRDACRLVVDKAPVCSLVDLDLPDATELDAPMQLRATAPELPIVVVTGRNDDRLGIEAVRLGAQEYLVKGGISQELLARVIRHSIERMQLELQLKHLALHDPLTGVANRTLFHDRLELALNRLHRSVGSVALAFVDLDDFKDINNRYGHDRGDALLTAVASRLASSVRNVDTVARYGGDEFVVLRESLQDPPDGQQLAEHIGQQFQEPFFCGSESQMITASVGVAIADGYDISGTSLIKQADLAMYAAKEKGGAAWHIDRSLMSRADNLSRTR